MIYLFTYVYIIHYYLFDYLFSCQQDNIYLSILYCEIDNFKN